MKYDLTGYNIDNLLKSLYLRKVTLQNVVRPSHDKVSFEIQDKDIKKVKRLITNFKIQQYPTKIKRLPKLLLANIGVLIGVFVGVIFSICASAYTWQIQIYGTVELSTQDILTVLADNNIKTGKINLQSSEEIEEILMNNYDRIAQVSVIREGTAIIINLSEKLVYNETEYAPIIASQNGVIRSINLITGTINVKVGDYVNAGDILVFPFNVNTNGDKVSVEPMAEIVAEMYVVTKCEMKRIETVLVRTGKTMTEYQYRFMRLNLFSGKRKNSFALFETVVYNEYISDLVPLMRTVTVYHELAKQEIQHDFATEKDTLIAESVDQAHEALPNGEILSEKCTTTIVDDTMYAMTVISVLGVIND